MSHLSTLDLVLVACVVAAAAAYLAWALLGRRTAPACHNPAMTRGASANEAVGGDVIIGASLQRGLDRARARRS